MSRILRSAIPALCLLAGATASLLMCGGPAPTFAENAPTSGKWDYSTATVDLGSLAGTLSELGTQGWEVFSVDHVVSYLDQQEADGKTRLVVEKMQVTAKRPQK